MLCEVLPSSGRLVNLASGLRKRGEKEREGETEKVREILFTVLLSVVTTWVVCLVVKY